MNTSSGTLRIKLSSTSVPNILAVLRRASSVVSEQPLTTARRSHRYFDGRSNAEIFGTDVEDSLTQCEPKDAE